MHFYCCQYFVQPFSSCIQQSCILYKVQHPAEEYILKVTWFHKMLTQVPKSYCSQCLTVTKSMEDSCNCLFASTSTVIVPVWIDVYLGDSVLLAAQSVFLAGFGLGQIVFLALLAEVLLRKPLACLCPQMDCQYSCFLLVQSLISPLETCADMGMAGSGIKMDMRRAAWLIWDHWYCFAKIHLHTANHMARQEWKCQQV